MSYVTFKNYTWPIQLFTNGIYMTNFEDDDKAVTIETTPKNIKYENEFNYLYFYIVNWDTTQSQVLDVEIMQTNPVATRNSRWLSVLSITSAAVLLLAI